MYPQGVKSGRQAEGEKGYDRILIVVSKASSFVWITSFILRLSTLHPESETTITHNYFNNLVLSLRILTVWIEKGKARGFLCSLGVKCTFWSSRRIFVLGCHKCRVEWIPIDSIQTIFARDSFLDCNRTRNAHRNYFSALILHWYDNCWFQQNIEYQKSYFLCAQLVCSSL